MAELLPHAFVVGHPIGHSRSPLIHRHWLAEHGLAGTYDPIDMAPERFEAFLAGLTTNGIVGGNVTLPHKEAAFRLVSRRDAAAERIGAVNTVWLEDGALVGSNTDAYGFAANLDQQVPRWRDARIATVLGAGGAARAIVSALVDAGIPQIRIVNRTVSRAKELATAFGPAVTAGGWETMAEALHGAGLLVNTTSLGMAGKEAEVPDLAPMAADAIVTDIVYVPLMTPLLTAARHAGHSTADGLGMLLHQAVPGFERWFGVRPVVTDELRRIILADLGSRK